jgi:hypothetical protein
MNPETLASNSPKRRKHFAGSLCVPHDISFRFLAGEKEERNGQEEGGKEKKGSLTPWPRRNECLLVSPISHLSRSHGRTQSPCQSFRQKQ